MTFIKPLEYAGHALVWPGDWSPEGARRAISGAARTGYDYIEIALLNPWKADAALTKDLLQEFNLRAHASFGLSLGTDVTSTNAAIVAKGDELLRKAADVLFNIGGKELCGVMFILAKATVAIWAREMSTSIRSSALLRKSIS